MAQCPHCRSEYAPLPEREFCINCGLRLSDSSPVTDQATVAGGLEPIQMAEGTGATEGDVKFRVWARAILRAGT